MNKTQTNVITVLERLVRLVQEDKNLAEDLSFQMEQMLDELNSLDAFGTEGQLDPRGDFRNGNWSMKNIECD